MATNSKLENSAIGGKFTDIEMRNLGTLSETEAGNLETVSETEVRWTVTIRHWSPSATRKQLLRSPEFRVVNENYCLYLKVYLMSITVLKLLRRGPKILSNVQVTLQTSLNVKNDWLNLGAKTIIMEKWRTSVINKCHFRFADNSADISISCNIQQISDPLFSETLNHFRHHQKVEHQSAIIRVSPSSERHPQSVEHQSTRKENSSHIENDHETYIELRKHFELLFDNPKFSDITVAVEGRNVSGHRVVLARSPVFSAMFEHETVERKTSTIVIEDFSFRVISELLRYVYTCEVEVLDQETMMELFAAADKYELLGLKKKCSEALAKDMLSDSSIDILIKADMHHDETLKEAAIQHILSNARCLMKTEKWMYLLQNYPELANNVMIRYVEKTTL